MKKELQEVKASAIAEYSATEAALSELRERLKDARYDVATTIGMDTAKKDRRELVTLRTSLETKRKEIKAPALERCRLIDDDAKRITSELLKLEQPIDAQIKAEEDRKAAIKAEKERIEKERVDGIQARITRIRNLPLGAVGKDAMSLEIYIAQIEAAQIGVEFAEFAEEAATVKAEVVTALNQALTNLKVQEEEEERLSKEREKLEEEKAQLAADETRKKTIREKLYKLSEPYVTPDMSAAEIEKLADQYKEQPITEAEYQEFTEEARKLHLQGWTALCNLHAAAVERESLAAQREELRKQQEEMDRKMREQEEAKAKAEREEAEKREQEAAERKRIEDEKQRADYEAKMTAATADYMTTLQSILNACNDSTLSAPAALQLVAELAKRGMKGAK